MSIRAFILGLSGAMFIAAAGYINDGLLQSTHLVGNHFPISVFGLLIVGVIAVNPVLGLLGPGWRLRPAEWALAVAMMLAACSIPGSGLLRTFTPTLIAPAHQTRMRPDWADGRVIRHIPPQMLPAGGDHDPKTIDGFITGLGRQNRSIGMGDVPWDQWATPLATWMPLLLLLAGSVICLSLIVHPQWSRREHLRYPIAAFATSLMGVDAGAGRRTIFREGGFWIALIAVLAVQSINGIAAWHPESIKIPLGLSFAPIMDTWPGLVPLPGVWQLVNVMFYPTVVALAFLLASEVSLSLGIAPFLLAAGSAVLLSVGVDMTGGYILGGVRNWQLFGSYLGLALLIAYTGRRYYWQVLRGALTFRRQAEAESYSVWACRIGIVCAAAVVALLVRLGLDWAIATLVVALVLMMFLVMARINAESGLFYCQPYWQPMAVFVGVFGFISLGPRSVAILAMLCAVLTIDPRECLMPFIVNGLRICEKVRIKPGRVGWVSAGVFAAALAVAVPIVLWANYNYGAFEEDGWATRSVPSMTLATIEQAVSETEDLPPMGPRGAWEGFKSMEPDGRFLAATGVGVGLVLIFSVLRLRFARFPLHPVMFLVWGTYPLGLFSHSFLLGWFVKSLVMRYGAGMGTYRKVERIMFGVIAGDLLAGLLFMIIGAVYYALTGSTPEEFRIFPS